MRPWKTCIAAWTIGLCGVCGAAWGQTYTLRAKVPVGTQVTFDNTQKDVARMSAPAGAGGAGATTTASTDHVFGHFEVTGAADGIPNAIRISFNSDSADTVRIDADPPLVTRRPFAGRTLNISLDASHKYTDDFKGDIEDDDRDELDEYLIPDADSFPDHPVSVGDFWDCSEKIQADTKLKKGEMIRQWCRLDSVDQVDGRAVATLTVSMASLTHETTESDRVTQMTGTMLIDLDRGVVTQITIHGSYTVAPTKKGGALADESAAYSGTYEQAITLKYTDPPTTQAGN